MTNANAQLSLIKKTRTPGLKVGTKINVLDSAKSAKLNGWCEANMDMLTNERFTYDEIGRAASEELGFVVTGANIQTKATKVFNLPYRRSGRKNRQGERMKSMNNKITILANSVIELMAALASERARHASLATALLNNLRPVFDVAGVDFSELEQVLAHAAVMKHPAS